MVAPPRARLRATLHRWGWLLRYWWLDKHARAVRAAALVVACATAALAAAHLALHTATATAAAGEPRRAYWQLIYYLVVLLLAAYVAYRAKAGVKPPDPQQGQAPEVKDGRSLREVFGTCWISDPTITSWVNGAPEPIQKKGGKK